MPALERAREAAWSADCFNKQHQLMLAVHMYSDGQYVPPAQNYDSGVCWDNILYNEGLAALPVLKCGKATGNSGIDYVHPTYGFVVNSSFRQSPPPPDQPNSNYVANGGWQGAGRITVPDYGCWGASRLCAFRYITRRGEGGYSNTCVGYPGDYINGYIAFLEPLRTSEVGSCGDTIAFEDGGWQQGADYIAPRHGVGCSPSDRWAFGEWFNVAWLDGHCSGIRTGPDPYHAYVGQDEGWWTITGGDSKIITAP
jgi:prepilin-type processing-associated H-X9-DG protein